MELRNVAIIAHVDHGKTTLVDKILHACQLFRKGQDAGTLILDNNDLEKERGITILSKNVSVRYKDYKINLIDTPGHADFGGEVERVLNMADGAILLVDAFEGPMPQTRYVLEKALRLGLMPLLVVNKVDKENCRPDQVQESVFDLMFALNADERQLEFQTVFGSAKHGWMGEDWQTPTQDVYHLLDQIVAHIPPPKQQEGASQMRITSIDYSGYIGRIAIGRVSRGTLVAGAPVMLMHRGGTQTQSRIKELYVFEGLGKAKAESVPCGELCALTGIEGFEIGDTVADFENPEALPPMPVDEPTMSMLFTINDSPFFGKEGKFVTSRHLRERLEKETEKNLALKLKDTDSPDKILVFGRGILHLSVLIETMRREGYELSVGQPQVLIRQIDGKKCEPIEFLSVDVPEESAGKVIELVSRRKGEMVQMVPKADVIHLEFNIPSRGIIGLSTQVLNATAGEALMSHRLKGYEPWKGEIETRFNGSLIAMEAGTSFAYAIDKLQERGKFFINPGEEVYVGQIIGEHSRGNDLVINVTKSKKLSNVRAAGSDDKVKIAPPIKFSLEEAMEYIQEDEYLEVTPENIRLRKILLNENDRKRAASKQK